MGAWGVTARQSDKGLDYLDPVFCRGIMPFSCRLYDSYKHNSHI